MQIIELILKILPLLGLIPFLKAVWEYLRDLKWKKSEYLAKEIKEFQNDENVKIIFQLLDWNKRKIQLKSGIHTVGDYDLVSALQTHDIKNRFTVQEAELRDIFDDFFDKLSMFNIYIKNGLISEKELHLYIGYYVEILTSTNRKPKILIETFQKYLKYYEFKNVTELIYRFKKY